MRSSSCANNPGADSLRIKSPEARLIRAKPTNPSPNERDRSQLSRVSSNKALSVRVPGVSTLTTCLSKIPLLLAGSPICSQIATDSPILVSLAKYCSAA